MRIIRRSSLLKRAESATKDNVKLILKKDPATQEFAVKWYEDGKYNEDKTYYTDDKQDAIDTMDDMIKRV